MPLVPTTAPKSFRINGRDLREFGIEATGIPDIMLPPVNERRQLIEGRAGSRDLGGYYGEWPFSVNGEIRGTSHNDMVSKLDRFRNWVDITQHYSDEYLVSRREVPSLKFEICGHKYNYVTGTVSVTNGSKIITGSGTLWSKYLHEGSQFTVEGDTNRYNVEHVNSNTEVVVDSNISRTSDSGLTYEAETKRFLPVNYNGESSISCPSHAHFVHGIFDLTFGFTATYPSFCGPIKIHNTLNPGANEFIEIEGIGNTPFSDFLIQVIGSSDNPKVVACDYSFVCNFNSTTRSRNIYNQPHDPAVETITGYRATRGGLGILFSGGGDYLSYTGLPSNPNCMSFFVRLYPQFAYNGAGQDRTVFEYRYDANNSLRLFYDQSEQKWTVTWIGNSNSISMTSSAQAFASDTEIEIAGTFYATNKFYDSTYYGLFYVNGVEEDTETSSAPTLMESAPTNLIIGSNNAHDEVANSIIDEVAIYTKPLSPDELGRLKLQQDWILNTNGSWEYNNSLDDGDILFLNGRSGITEVYDASEGARTNINQYVAGRIPSIRGDEDQKQWVFLPNAMKGFNLVCESHWM